MKKLILKNWDLIKINPEELGPLSYIAGYVLQSLYKKS